MLQSRLRLSLGLGVSTSVDDTGLAGLDEVVGNKKVLLVGAEFEVVRTNDTLVFTGVVKTLGFLRSDMSRAATWLPKVSVK